MKRPSLDDKQWRELLGASTEEALRSAGEALGEAHAAKDTDAFWRAWSAAVECGFRKAVGSAEHG
eukprot:4949817-Alexandrium_andersonii.AAC.1